jgi:hypothetical protein
MRTTGLRVTKLPYTGPFTEEDLKMPRSCPTHLPARHFSNIDLDPGAADALKEECIALLETAASEDDARNKYEVWRIGAKSAGKVPFVRVTDVGATERIGRLRYRDNYAADLADVLRRDPAIGGVDESDIDELVNWIFGEPTRLDPTVAQGLFELILFDALTEAVDTAWFFRTSDHGSGPFNVPEVGCLPWRLGLKFVRSGSRYAGFSIQATAVMDPRRPTFAEVHWDFHELWRPTGKTEPIPSCPKACVGEGLDELIAVPPRFRDTEIPLRLIAAT